MRHPDRFTGFLSMSGAFDPSKLPRRLLRTRRSTSTCRHTTWRTSAIAGILDRYESRDLHSGHRLGRPTALGRTRTLCGSWARKSIPHHSVTSGTRTMRTDWPTWARMMNEYL